MKSGGEALPPPPATVFIQPLYAAAKSVINKKMRIAGSMNKFPGKIIAHSTNTQNRELKTNTEGPLG